MKTKLLLRFYFYADGVERAIDNLIIAVACSGANAEQTAEKIIYLRECKDRLSELWAYLDNVVSGFDTEADILRGYIEGREDIGDKALKRVLMRFRRHAAGAERFKDALALLRRYSVFCRSG